MHCSLLILESLYNSDDNFQKLKGHYAEFCPALERGRHALEEGQTEEVKEALDEVQTLSRELRSCGIDSPFFVDFAPELSALLNGRRPIEEADTFERDARAFLESYPQSRPFYEHRSRE